MQSLPNKTIGGKSITIKRVPASAARKIQTLIVSSAAKPLAEVFTREVNPNPSQEEIQKIGLIGMGELLSSLGDSELDNLIKLSQPFILVDGKTFDEDRDFDSKTLLAMYEVIWFFLKETFGDFLQEVLNIKERVERFMTAMSQ